MDTGVRNPILFIGDKYIGNGERNKDDNFNISSPNLQIKPDPYLSINQMPSLESKKNQTNTTKENDKINPFYKGSKTFDQNRSQSDISNNNIINNNISNNNNMVFNSDQIKKLQQENDFKISINSQISSINFSINTQNQLMTQIQQQINKLNMDQNTINNQFQQQINKLTNEHDTIINQFQQQINKLTNEQDDIKNQIGKIEQMLSQQKQFFETQMTALTTSIQQLNQKNNIINNSNQINNINNTNQFKNFNEDNRNSFNNNNNLNSIGPNNNNIVKFEDSKGTFEVVFKEDELFFRVIQKYRNQASTFDNKKFIFNGREIHQNLSCKDANLTNNSTIYVVDP